MIYIHIVVIKICNRISNHLLFFNYLIIITIIEIFAKQVGLIYEKHNKVMKYVVKYMYLKFSYDRICLKNRY